MRHYLLGTCLLAAVAASGFGCAGEPEETVESEDVVGADDDTAVLEDALTGSVAVGTTLSVTASGLNLRSSPSTSASVLTVMPNGAKVTVVQSAPNNGFYRVKFNSLTGWASGSYLKVAASTPPGGNVPIIGPAVRPHVQGFANSICSSLTCPFEVMTREGHDPSADRALDFMASPIGTITTAGTTWGNQMSAATLGSRWNQFKVLYVIWRQRINSNDGRGWRGMEDRGSITQNHFDHVHVSFKP